MPPERSVNISVPPLVSLAVCATVSHELTRLEIGFSTMPTATPTGKPARTWRFGTIDAKGGPVIDIGMYVSGPVFAVSTCLAPRAGANVDRLQAQAAVVEESIAARVHYEQYGGRELYWVRVQFPIDAETPPHLLPGVVLLGLEFTVGGSKRLLAAFPEQLEYVTLPYNPLQEVVANSGAVND